MANQLAISNAKVTMPDGTVHDEVRIIARVGVARVTRRSRGPGAVVAERLDFLSVDKPTPRGPWLVKFADGTVWQAQSIAKPCPCRNGR